MDELMRLIGMSNDDKKSEDDSSEMMGLGHWLLVSFQQGKVETRLDQDKASRWSEDLMEVLRTERCSPALASKFAGRFS